MVARPQGAVQPNPATPLTLYYKGEKICDVSLLERPAYYKEKLGNGKPVSDIAPTIEWGYLIYITAFRLCQYWGDKEECQFCDINENYRQQKREKQSKKIMGQSHSVEGMNGRDRIINAAKKIPPKKNSQNPNAFMNGKATSRAPICKGITAFIKAKTSGIAAKKIIVVPCIVIISLYSPALTKSLFGTASWIRITIASSPPTKKKNPPATKYKMAIFLWSTVVKKSHIVPPNPFF